MVYVDLPIFDPIEEDFLRYRFNSWQGAIKITTWHPIGEGIISAVHASHEQRKHTKDTKTVRLAIPNHPLLNLSRYPHHFITMESAMRIKMEIKSAYYTEVNRAVTITRRRTHKLKPAIDLFLDALELVSGDYNLSINYDQIRKMITRDDLKVKKLLHTLNKNSDYKTFM